MNPRVSRSSALASKATGYPIAKVAAKLAVGYTLDEIPNDLTGTTPASFEPTLDYVVVKLPRFAFEKFPGADRTLGTQMKSVGESMGIGRTFAEAFAKARRGLEIDQLWRAREPASVVRARARGSPQRPTGPGRLPACRLVRRRGRGGLELLLLDPRRARTRRRRQPGRSVVILGSGPNRIGQGIEFDYCCVHAAQSFRAQGFEAVMVNCNPETVSTDYDTSDRLYFEPLDEEAVLAVLEREQPVGVCIQFGGQTPLKLARAIERAGFRILGTPFDAIDLAEDRERFGRLADERRRALPGVGDRRRRATRRSRSPRAVGYPVLVRPSYVLGGRAMRVCYDAADVAGAMAAVDGAVLVDRFLENAIELDVDALCDGADDVRRRGDGARRGGRASTPATRRACCRRRPTRRRSARSSAGSGRALGVVGLLNVQLAIHGGEVYVLEVTRARRARCRSRRRRPASTSSTPRAASPRAPGSPSSGCRPRARPAGPPRQGGGAAVRALPRRRPGARAGDALDRRGDGERRRLRHGVREGRARGGTARCPPAGARSSACATRDKIGVRAGRARARRSSASSSSRPTGTARALAARRHRGRARARRASAVGRRSSASRGVDLVVNTPEGRNARTDGYAIREAAVVARVPCITTLAVAARRGRGDREGAGRASALSLQERHARSSRRREAPRSVVARRGGRARTRSLRVTRGALEPGVPGPVLHARGARPGAAAADVALPRAARRARVPDRPGRAGHAGARRARAGRRDRGVRPARATASGSTCRRPLLVGGGIGIAPFPYLAEALERPPALLGFRSEHHAEAAALAAERGGRDRPGARHGGAAARTATCSRAAPSRCSRPCARSRPTRSSPGRRRWRAATAPATAASSRSTARLERLCVEGPVLCSS